MNIVSQVSLYIIIVWLAVNVATILLHAIQIGADAIARNIEKNTQENGLE